MVERIRSLIDVRPGPADSAPKVTEDIFAAGETGGGAARAAALLSVDGRRVKPLSTAAGADDFLSGPPGASAWTPNAKKGAVRPMILVACLLPVFAGQLADFPNPAVLRADSNLPVRQELKLAAAALPARAADKPSENKAPDFTLTSLDGSRVTLSNYRGKKGVVLVFFATWCVNCMREVPEIKKFALVAQKANIEVLAVNFKQRKNIVEKFHKAQEINYRVLLDEDGAVTLDKYGIKGLPHIVGVNLKGETIYRGEDLPVNRTEFIEKLIQGP